MNDYHLGPFVICAMEIDCRKGTVTYWINEYLGEIIEEFMITKAYTIWDLETDNGDWDNIKKWSGIVD